MTGVLSFSSRNGTDDREIELKFSGLDGAALRVRESPIIRRWATGAPTRGAVKCTYYDTRARHVQASGLSLRLCEEDGHFTQTIKSSHTNSIENLSRFELETELSGSGDFPSGQGLAATPEIARLISRHGPALMPYVRSDVMRWAVMVRWRASRIEVSIDEGRLVAWPFDGPLREQPLSQIELELVEGPAAGLFEFAEALTTECALQFETASKEALGRRLMAGEGPPVSKWGPLDLSREASVAQALDAWYGAASGQVITALEALRAGQGAAAPALREGLRALRLLDALFPSLAQDQYYKSLVSDTKQYVRLARAATRPARLRQQVVIPQLAGKDTSQADHAVLHACAEALEEAQGAAETALRALASRSETTQFTLALRRFALTEGWQALLKEQEKSAAVRLLGKRLSRFSRRLGRATGHLSGPEPAAQYRRVKARARVLDMLAVASAPLFPAGKQRRYRQALKELRRQVRRADMLHRLPDIFLTATPAELRDSLQVTLGAYWLTGYARATLESSAPRVYEAARAVAREKPYWR